jgi:hypothetical protein
MDLYFSLLERTLLHTPDCSLGGLERVQKYSLLSVTGVAEKGRGGNMQTTEIAAASVSMCAG